MSYTIIIIVITAIVSYLAFNDERLMSKLILWPKRMDSPGEYYRLVTSGFIHADAMHLIFNMLTLFFFGRNVETILNFTTGRSYLFIVLYILGIIVASLPSFMKNRHNGYYRSLGASGGVAAVLFAFIYFAPWETIYLLFIPVPGILAGVGYLVYSVYMSKQGRGNVNHDAHFWGAVFGIVFMFIFDPTHGQGLLYNLMHPTFKF